MNFGRLDKTKESRLKACDVKYHAREIAIALEVYYWTGEPFHYYEAIDHVESLISDTAKMQEIHDKETTRRIENA